MALWWEPRGNPLLTPEADQPVQRQPSPGGLDLRCNQWRWPGRPANPAYRGAWDRLRQHTGWPGDCAGWRHREARLVMGFQEQRAEGARHDVLVRRRRRADLRGCGPVDRKSTRLNS